MNHKHLYTAFNLISFIVLIFISVMFNGAEVFKLSGVNPLLMPASYAFYIWILIYVLLGIWIFRYGFSGEDEVVYCKVSRFFSVSLISCGMSLLVRQPNAIFFILFALLTALFMYISIQRTPKRSVFFRIPISIYLAWLLIAFVLEMVLVLTSLGVVQLFGLSELFLTIFAIILLGLISIYFAQLKGDRLFALTFIWAEIAIAINNIHHLPILFTTCGVIILTGFMLDRYPVIKKSLHD